MVEQYLSRLVDPSASASEEWTWVTHYSGAKAPTLGGESLSPPDLLSWNKGTHIRWRMEDVVDLSISDDGIHLCVTYSHGVKPN